MDRTSQARDFEPTAPLRALTSPSNNAHEEPQQPIRSQTGLVPGHGHSSSRLSSPWTNRGHPSNSPATASPSSLAANRARNQSVASATGSLRQRVNRSNTVRTYKPADRPHWRPGAEPGIDPSKDEPAHGFSSSHIYQQCDITVVDFNADRIEQYELDNPSLPAFLERERAPWVACRWYCINGLSWDVIKCLGSHKELHRLAIEDLMNTRSRTKADWYTDHCYMVLTLQKLVQLHAKQDGYDHDSDDTASDYDQEEDNAGWTTAPKKRKKRSMFRNLLRQRKTAKEHAEPIMDSGLKTAASPSTDSFVQPIRTLHRYRGGPDVERIMYMEQESPLARRNLAVGVEQVSMFLTADNTVLTFFEHSAQDILDPISDRLHSEETILRLSSDASMLVQAVIDAIIDLGLPVAAAYDDAIGALEMDVLTDPDMSQPRELYMLTSEITLLRNTIAPIGSLVNALRDHRSDPVPQVAPPNDSPDFKPPQYKTTPSSDSTQSQTQTRHQQHLHHQADSSTHHRPSPSLSRHASHAPSSTQPPQSGSSVVISPLAHTYLGDVEDHVISLTTSLSTSINSAENLTSLIFNTVGAYQNENMKQLTLVTIFFLPLTFLTGYFGQNFEVFDAVKNNSDAYFWWCAVPVMVVTLCFCLRSVIARFVARQIRSFAVRQRRKKSASVAGSGSAFASAKRRRRGV